MKKIIFLILFILFFIGCGDKQPTTPSSHNIVKKIDKIIDPCEIEYQKCSFKCELSVTKDEPKWKKLACEAKCKTLYGTCKAKQKTIEGYHYLKNKLDDKK